MSQTLSPCCTNIWTPPHDQVCIFIPLHQHIPRSSFLPFFPLNCILSCQDPNFFEHIHLEWTYSLVPSRVYCSSGVGLGLLVTLEKSLLDRGSPLVCAVPDKTHVCWDIVGWAPGEGKVFLARFWYEIGTTNVSRCRVPVSRDYTIGPKSWKMVIIIPRRRGGTWEGLPVEIWCSEWICRSVMRGGLVHHTIMIPAALSLPLLRGACSRSCTYNISKWLVLYQNLQFFPVSNFDC